MGAYFWNWSLEKGKQKDKHKNNVLRNTTESYWAIDVQVFRLAPDIFP